jgi:hypothetical protein
MHQSIDDTRRKANPAVIHIAPIRNMQAVCQSVRADRPTVWERVLLEKVRGIWIRESYQDYSWSRHPCRCQTEWRCRVVFRADRAVVSAYFAAYDIRVLPFIKPLLSFFSNFLYTSRLMTEWDYNMDRMKQERWSWGWIRWRTSSRLRLMVAWLKNLAIKNDDDVSPSAANITARTALR